MTDIASLVSERQQVRAHLDAQDEAYKNYCKPYREQIEKLDAQITEMMVAQKIKSLKTDTGTAILSEITTPRIIPEQRDQYIDWCLDNWSTFGGEMMQIGSPKVEAVRSYMDANQGHLPPHIDITRRFQFSIRKA